MWRSWGDVLGARLVQMGLLPQSYARRRLSIALELMSVRRMAVSGQTSLELEACLQDSEVPVAVEALKRLQGTAPASQRTEAETSPISEDTSASNHAQAVLALLYCPNLTSPGLEKMVEAMILGCEGNLQVLYLEGCAGLGDSAIESLCSLFMTRAPQLKDLGVVKCGLTADGLLSLSNAVQGFPAEVPDIPMVSALGIAQMLAGGPPPLLGAPPPIADDGFDMPSVGLPKSAENLLSIVTLRLSGNVLAGAGRSLASVVKGLTQLQWLSVESCELKLEDLQQLSRALPRSNLSRLDLADNLLRSKGLLAVINGLRTSRLQDLGIERNEIGVGEALSELKAAHDKRPFPTLRLAGNRLSSGQQALFLQGLRSTPRNKRMIGDYCPPSCTCYYGRDHVM